MDSDWNEVVNLNLADHEARIQMLEKQSRGIDFDDFEYAIPSQAKEIVYDLRTPEMRRDARLNNHDQRLRALEHRLLMLELQVAELRASNADD